MPFHRTSEYLPTACREHYAVRQPQQLPGDHHADLTTGTISQVKVNTVLVGVTAGQYQVPANGTYSVTWSTAPPTVTTTQLAAPINTSSYPWIDPVYQNFQVQQYLTVAGVTASGTDD
jgi:hypothetical protein